MQIHTPREVALLAKDARRGLGISQHTLAARIGASRQWVQNLEAGGSGLELGLTLRALAALGIALEARRELDRPEIHVVNTPAAATVGHRLAARKKPQAVRTATTRLAGATAKANPGIIAHAQAAPLMVADINSLVASPSSVAGPVNPKPAAVVHKTRRRR